MITVTRRVLSEDEVAARLAVLAVRYGIPSCFYEEIAADRMSDFDAQKWLSLCDLLKTSRRRRQEVFVDSEIPYSLRSIYGMKAPFPSEELENVSDTLIALAA